MVTISFCLKLQTADLNDLCQRYLTFFYLSTPFGQALSSSAPPTIG